MRSHLRGLLLGPALAAATLLAIAGCGSSASPRRSAALVAIGAGVHGRAGLKARLYAQGPATTAAFAFDPQGRLWLTAAGLETHTHDGVYVIAKAGAPAREVISGLDDPLGLDWYRGRLYVASVGRVDSYGAFNGTRFTEHSEVLAGPVAGAENNLLVMGSDGRFLMGVSAPCDHCKPASPFAGAIVSFNPDGSDLRIYAGGIRAPFGLAFLPGTSELFASMNQRDDLGAKTPGDWLSRVREGQHWGSPACYGQGGSACRGVPAPTAVLDKHAAAGGVVFVSGKLAGGSGTSALVAEWELGKVQSAAIERRGSEYEAAVTPFLTGIANPLALALAPDGSLLVGSWASGKIYAIS